MAILLSKRLESPPVDLQRERSGELGQFGAGAWIDYLALVSLDVRISAVLNQTELLVSIYAGP